jgi:PAS domain S-box-containing protein
MFARARKLFRDVPIERKMVVLTLLICGAVLCVAVAALFTFQVLNFRSNFQRDTATLAQVIANNSTAALAFKEEETAKEVVSALKAEPSVAAASLVLPDGSVLAHFGEALDAETRSHFPPVGNGRFAGSDLLVCQQVILKREHIGTLYMRSNYRRTFLELLGFYAQVILGVMAVSVLLAGFLARQLGRTITRPVLELAQTAHVVGERKDYSVRAVVENRRDELGGLADSFNEMLARIQSQDEALSLSQRKMEALIHSIDGIVWERNAVNFQFTFVSRQSEDIFGFTPMQWMNQPDFWQSRLHPDDSIKAVETSRQMAAQAQPYTQEYRMLAADDRTVWIRESGTVLVERGKPVAMRGIFQDITRQKLDSEQLDKLNRQLMEISRQAGMAEVATGVLHNVGNVLNSVSVSATLVSDRLRKLKIDHLRQATALLAEQNGRLPEFLSSDPKGKVLLPYIATVADQLAGQQTKLISQMDSVGQHVEHIKEIVAMQQTYAKVSGVYETLPVAALVEDALRMNAAAFDRHHIELHRDFAENIPPVCVDRHKVLQILINLLRNAKYALSSRGENEKRITIRIAMASPQRVKIVVADNGVGIAPEHLAKIFRHGFTTKKDGHGFGLHSGANAAKEMGGTLSCLSDGVGQGAEFSLELPVATFARSDFTPATIHHS